jgi:hypothetical protein
LHLRAVGREGAMRQGRHTRPPPRGRRSSQISPARRVALALHAEERTRPPRS